MADAAIYWNPEAYDTSGTHLMGRHSAGEGFIRGYIRHGRSERLNLWNIVAGARDKLEPLVRALEPSTKPIHWIGQRDLGGLKAQGVVNLPVPGLSGPAWTRRLIGDRAYSICGVTHTTCTPRVLDTLMDYAIGPVQPWDAVVCTSRAVVASLQVQAEMQDAYLEERFGARVTVTRPQYPVIPLGIPTDDFAPSAEHRRRWRDELLIAEDDVVILYVGRFSLSGKMNPATMAMVIEQAAKQTGRKLHWVLAGWAPEGQDTAFQDAIAKHAPSIETHYIDGRKPENRHSIWSVGDIFISLCDNYQETFGLTPVEAKAAGLPVLVSDWDGYKDTVRDGVDGFRIPTMAPTPGLGRDIALMFAQEWLNYSQFVAVTSQFVSIDLPAAVQALVRLVNEPELRRRMGEAAREHALATYDWKHIIPQYEALWDELDARRRAAPPEPPRTRNATENPWRPDPFRMFAGYASETVTTQSVLVPVPGMDWAAVQPMLSLPLVRMGPGFLPSDAELQTLLAALAEGPQLRLADLLERFPAGRRPFIERGVVWLSKYGMLQIIPRYSALPL